MTGAQFDELIAAVERIARAQERIAAALEGPPVQAKPAAEPSKGCADGVHAEKFRVTFGSDDEFECSPFKGGCGYRSPALAGAGV